jgi:vacuolar-type H+-ATPase subunit I/STV1
MEPINVSTREFYIYSLLLSVGFGVLVGLVPLVFGFIKHRRKYAFLGFVLTIAGSALLGLLLAIPMAAIFSWLIYRDSGQPATSAPSVPSDEPPAS